MTNYYWDLKAEEEAKVIALEQELKSTRKIICRILVRRGLEKTSQIKDFIKPDLNKLYDPFLMKDMSKVVSAIVNAISKRSKILIWGDYDVDGTSSVALLYRYLSKISDTSYFDYYIPDRYSEGYGISGKGIDYAIKNNFRLIISLDCGITSVDLIESALKNGIQTIICDHHLPGSKLPDATAILDPKLPGDNYPFRELCGCGVTFKLISALNSYLNLPAAYCYDLLDLVALATGADIVPLTGENRILTWHGLKKINSTPCAGIEALKEICGKEFYYSNERIAFYLAPRINAAGRMAHGKLSVELLIEDDLNRAKELAKKLETLNDQRKYLLDAASGIALEKTMSVKNYSDKKTIVLCHKEWHPGILGIVASKMTEIFYKPAIILKDQGELLTGSARSINGFNIYEALKECNEYLEKFGGHSSAAGLSVHKNNLDAFMKQFEEIVSKTILPEELIPKISIDCEIDFKEIDFRLYNTLHKLEPFGPENPKPVFLTRKISVSSNYRILQDKHVRFSFNNCNSSFLTGIGFNMAEKLTRIDPGRPVDFVYTLEVNKWNGNSYLQLNLIDFRNSN